jgi:hypothetical protein
MLKGPLAGYIGIPFFDQNKENIIHIQGRLFAKLNDEDMPKYMFLKDKLDDINLDNKEMWGLWRTTPDRPTIICEGTLDACAFRNGIATCGATVGESFINSVIKQFPNRIWCMDSFWKDKEGRKLTEKLLKMNETCFIIPKDLENIKDANDYLCKVLKTKYIEDDIIHKCSFKGKLGLSNLKFKQLFNH